MFKEVSSKVNLPELEEKVLQWWEKEKVFEKSIEERPESSTFYFYDGPPFATGLPHYGHILAGTIKDVIPRYQTMLGKRVERRFGWDTHGLPVEFEVEKELGLRGGADIKEMGIAAFNEKCRSIVLRYANEWKQTVKRMGRWIDVENDYKTMDPDFMESIWWVFKSLWNKGLIYESGKIVAYSARLETPLSNFEVNLGYRDVQDPSVSVKFKIKERENEYFLAWTTTPWTLPSNLGLVVHPELDYVKIKHEDSIYYLAKDLLTANFDEEQIEVLEEVKGATLEGIAYEPLFPWFAHYSEQGAFKIMVADYVSTETGTGIVHTAPMFGEEDHKTGKRYGLPELMPMNERGEFQDCIEDFAGMFFKDADKHIIKQLKERGLMFKHETMVHSYPFCWRSDTPLMYRSIRSWFVNVEKIKENMIANNQEINWSPAHIKNGRMGKWLEGARDWAISRNRFWGTPIPVWICDECGHQHCIGDKTELEQLTGAKVDDLHRHFVDDLHFDCPACKAEKAMKRTPEVLDCWFESGSMPYGQEHYPFENKEKFDNAFPADFISEGLDQTRGWFYTLSVLSAALFEKPAFKNCIVSGMLLAEDGKKMSKSLKNYPDPWDMINKYGADVIRLYMLNSGAIRAEELKFSESGLQETIRNNMIPLWNSLSFFTTYANIDKWEPTLAENPEDFANPLDRWILSQLQHLIGDVRTALDKYDLNKAVQPFVGFIDMLTNWYIRRSRRRFWKDGEGQDKINAYTTLYTVLLELSKVIAPFVPFLAENVYSVLKTDQMEDSVHLCEYPQVDEKWLNTKLDSEMDIILKAVNMGRGLRAKNQIKNRQPLQTITLVTKNQAVKGILGEMADLIKDELNLKDVEIAENEEELVTFSAKPNLKILGKQLGKNVRFAREQIMAFDSERIIALQNGDKTTIDLNGEPMEIGVEEILIERTQKEGLVVANEGDLTIALDIKPTEKLIFEGYTRDFINKIQTNRKEQDFEVTDRIKISYAPKGDLKKALELFTDLIKQETLADEMAVAEKDDSFFDFEIAGIKCALKVERV